MKKRLAMNIIFIILCLIFSFNCASAKSVKVKKIKVNIAQKSIVVGKSIKLKYKILPSNASNKKIKITSSNTSVAIVKSNRKIKALKPGKTTIVIKSKSNKKVKKKIKLQIKAQDIKKNKTQNTTKNTSVNTKKTLGVYSTSESQSIKSLQVLSETGLSTLKTPTGIVITDEIVELDAGESYQLQANLIPADANGKIVWSTDHVGGINLYPNGSIYITDDTPQGTTAIVYASCGNLRTSCTIVCRGADHEHVWEEASRQEASCMQDGSINYKCSISGCNHTKTEAIAAKGHVWDQGTITSQPTCTQKGLKTFRCTKCGESKEEDVPVVGHTWDQGEIIIEPTCTAKGKKRYTCSVCQMTKDVAMDANGHSWDQGEVTKEATCTQTGIKTYKCTIEGCSGTKTETIQAHGHTYDYGEITVEPTCVGKGQRISTCLTCGNKTKVILDLLGHDWDEGVVTEEPTCTKNGVKTYTCTRDGCGATRTESISKLGHIYPTVVDENGNEDYVYTIEKEPTCEVKGIKYAVCTRCGRQDHAQGIPPLGHDWDEGVVSKEAKCTSTGMRIHTCKREGCDASKEVVIPSLGHDWDEDYTIDEFATCTLAGKKSKHCSRCNLTKDICAVPALGHDFGVGMVKVAATCTKEGIMHYICQRDCGMWKDEPIKALGHDYAEDFTTDVVPTCTNPGSKSRHCARCDNKGYVTQIPANGHTWGAWTTITEATCTLAGLKERICSVCNETQKEAVSVKGHTNSDDGTCSTCGQVLDYQKTEESDWTYLKDTENKKITLKQYIGKNKNIIIPKSLNIREKKGNETVETEYIVDGFKANSGNAQSSTFTSSQKLVEIETVKFEDGLEIEDISYLFANCDKLKVVENIPSSVKKADHAFENCSSLENIVGGLPEELSSMDFCFKDCTTLESSPDIPAGVKSLDSVYKGAIALKVAPEIPDGVEILDRTFSGCSSLYMPPALPESVTSLIDTFRDCTSLEETTNIPSNVTALIGTYYGCTSLKIAPLVPSNIVSMKYTYMNCTSLTYAAPLPVWVKEKEDVFTGCNML